MLLVFPVIVLMLTGACTPGSSPTASQSPADERSGIRGTSRFDTVSGVPGGQTTSRPASIEFAIAPVQDDKPVYEKAIFVKSDAQGTFTVDLPPGTYWLGAREKALNPAHYSPGDVVFSEMTVVVPARTFVSVTLVQTGYAP
jgi:hypothetical protein